MKKNEFVECIVQKTKTSKSYVNKIFDATQKLITEVLNKGGEVSLAGFGKFVAKERGEVLRRNPITKRFYYSEKKKYVNFKAFKRLKYCIK